MSEQPLDLVLLGATGFTGRLVAEYLLEAAPQGLRWALAGRNREKLEALRSDLGMRFVGAGERPILVVDTADTASLQAMARAGRVVCTTVGPYAQYGEGVVAACAEAGTHYCDLTGEVPFIRAMIDRYHETARGSGARIVHCCGFDSIPSDLGALMVGDALMDRGARPDHIRYSIHRIKGGMSGGTLASLMGIMEAIKKEPSLAKVMAHPYSLNPQNDRAGADKGDQVGIRYDQDLGSWTGPFLMAPINTRIVRRSHALRGRPYGPDFRYAESMSTGGGAAGWTRAAAMTGGLGGLMAALQVGPLRRLAQGRLPKPGEGPSPDEQAAGYFVARLIGDGKTDGGASVRLYGEVRGERDPGYGETAKMLGESALCLALDEDKLPAGGGSLTPATAMGHVLIERLRQAGMTFRVADNLEAFRSKKSGSHDGEKVDSDNLG